MLAEGDAPAGDRVVGRKQLVSPAQADSASAGANIMIVDDDKATLEVLRIYLESYGYENITLLADSTRVMDNVRIRIA
jgi:hypothetical protein